MTRFSALAAAAAAAASLGFPGLPLVAQQDAPPASLRVLTVGGGPRPKMNQVAIESNVRYVDGLLPKDAPRTVLFADGSRQTPSVTFWEEGEPLPPAESVLRFLLGEDPDTTTDRFRAPYLPVLSGPAKKATVAGALANLGASSSDSLLLYFTGHGDRARSGDLDNNTFALWGEETLSVRDLAGELAKLPTGKPVVLVMVQCFAGAFGNVLFENGDPEAGSLVRRPLCGFFATTRERVAAGCTPEVDEQTYHDFTGYFFAALSGRDRLGRAVSPPDYDKNGTVGMNEAFAYALIEEPSIDVPVSTSDVFLRRYVPMADDAEVAAVPFADVRAMASPAQRAALDGISRKLEVNDKGDRLRTALTEVRERAAGPSRRARSAPRISRETRALAAHWLNTLTSRFPGLAGKKAPATYAAARKSALAYLTERPAVVEKLRAAQNEVGKVTEARYADELRGALWLRLIRVAKSVVLEKRLRASGNAARIAQFDRLRKLESANPLRKS